MPPAEDVQAQLDKVSAEIAAFELRKLNQLKGELQSFVNKKKSVLEDYVKKHAGLLDQWRKQNNKIAELHATLTCMFPNGEWRKLLDECACPRYKDLADRTAALTVRLVCSLGANEKLRDEAEVVSARAKLNLDGLVANTKGLTDALTANAKTISIIHDLLSGPRKPEAIQYMWLDLLPKHVALAPLDLPTTCLDYATGEEPWKMCDSIPAPAAFDAKNPRSPPWLIDPGQEGQTYDDMLDTAWAAYRDTREAAARTADEFAQKPDDVTTTTKKLDADLKARDAEIRECLAQLAKPGPVCHLSPPPAARDADGSGEGSSHGEGITRTTPQQSTDLSTQSPQIPEEKD